MLYFNKFKSVFLLGILFSSLCLQAMEDLRQLATAAIDLEVGKAKAEGRDFAFDYSVWKDHVNVLGEETFKEELVKAIRKHDVEILDDSWNAQAVGRAINMVKNAVTSLDKGSITWRYVIGTEKEEKEENTQITLMPSSRSLELGNVLSGYERFREPIYDQGRKIKNKIPAMNWANDEILKKSIGYAMKEKKKARSGGLTVTSLTRARIRQKLAVTHCAHYPASFPIPVVMWVLNREKERMQHPLKYLDPCMGWGCRLAGSLLVGKDVCKEYIGFDPWSVSHALCEKIKTIVPAESACATHFTLGTAEDEDLQWPNDIDLVFTSPPYGKVECYNLGSGGGDGQAWRRVDDKTFVSHFLRPLLAKSARATTNNNGRVMINIGNDAENDECARLTKITVEEAMRAGLELVEIIGMTKPKQGKTSALHKGEHIFVFGHHVAAMEEGSGAKNSRVDVE